MDHETDAPAAPMSPAIGHAGLYTALRVLGVLAIVGAVFLWFGLYEEGLGFLGAGIALQAVVTALVLFAVARIGDGIDDLLSGRDRLGVDTHGAASNEPRP